MEACSDARSSGRPRDRVLPPELQRAPARVRREPEQRAPALRLGIAEVAARLVEADLEEPDLDAVVEVGAPEDELLQPVDERLAVVEREPLPVPHQVLPERAARLVDPTVRDELDE